MGLGGFLFFSCRNTLFVSFHIQSMLLRVRVCMCVLVFARFFCCCSVHSFIDSFIHCLYGTIHVIHSIQFNSIIMCSALSLRLISHRMSFLKLELQQISWIHYTFAYSHMLLFVSILCSWRPNFQFIQFFIRAGDFWKIRTKIFGNSFCFGYVALHIR